MAYDEFTAKMVRKCSELEKALAENVALYAKQVGEALERLTDDFIFRLAEKDHAYQQLMEKAVGLAKILMGASSEAEQYMTGEQFLKSSEVQAWKERKT